MTTIQDESGALLAPGFRLRRSLFGKLILQRRVWNHTVRGYTGPEYVDATMEDVFAYFLNLQSFIKNTKEK